MGLSEAAPPCGEARWRTARPSRRVYPEALFSEENQPEHEWPRERALSWLGSAAVRWTGTSGSWRPRSAESGFPGAAPVVCPAAWPLALSFLQRFLPNL